MEVEKLILLVKDHETI